MPETRTRRRLKTAAAFFEKLAGYGFIIKFTVPQAAVFHKGFQIPPYIFICGTIQIEHGGELVCDLFCNMIGNFGNIPAVLQIAS